MNAEFFQMIFLHLLRRSPLFSPLLYLYGKLY